MYQSIFANINCLLFTFSQEKVQGVESANDNDVIIVDNYESDDGDDILAFIEKGSYKASFVPKSKRKTRRVLTENGFISEPKDHMK